MKKLSVFLTVSFMLLWSFDSVALADTRPVQEPDEVLPAQSTAPVEKASTPKIAGRPASPQAYQLNWLSINGGGVIRDSSTSYRLGFSIGQSVAGACSSSTYKLGIGFWYGTTSAPTCAAAKGDMDASGTWTPADAGKMLLCVYVVGWPGCDLCFADVNCSGNLTPSDAALELLRVYVLQPFPC